LSDCNACNGVKTRFWTIATPAMVQKPGFGRLQRLQWHKNPVLSDCNACNGVKTRFWTIATPAMA